MRMVSVIALAILLVACQPAALAPTVTAAPPTVTLSATRVAPTSTPVPPTGTPAPPTATLPPIPTADFALADIVGIWTRLDSERGQLYLIFKESGAYVASHGTPEGVVHAGHFTLEGALFTFVDGWNCSPLEDQPGRYLLRLGGGGKYLFFEPYQDGCPDRPNGLRSYRWNQYTPAP